MPLGDPSARARAALCWGCNFAPRNHARAGIEERIYETAVYATRGRCFKTRRSCQRSPICAAASAFLAPRRGCVYSAPRRIHGCAARMHMRPLASSWVRGRFRIRIRSTRTTRGRPAAAGDSFKFTACFLGLAPKITADPERRSHGSIFIFTTRAQESSSRRPCAATAFTAPLESPSSCTACGLQPAGARGRGAQAATV